MKFTLGKGKGEVEVGQYDGGEGGYSGYIQPTKKNAQWVIFVKKNGDAVFYKKREKTGAVVGNADLLKIDPPKDDNKEFNIDLTLYARGTHRKPSVLASFEPGLRREDDEAFNELNGAIHKFCQHLIDEEEL